MRNEGSSSTTSTVGPAVPPMGGSESMPIRASPFDVQTPELDPTLPSGRTKDRSLRGFVTFGAYLDRGIERFLVGSGKWGRPIRAGHRAAPSLAERASAFGELPSAGLARVSAGARPARRS